MKGLVDCSARPGKSPRDQMICADWVVPSRVGSRLSIRSNAPDEDGSHSYAYPQFLSMIVHCTCKRLTRMRRGISCV